MIASNMPKSVVARYRDLKERHQARDTVNLQVAQARRGEIEAVMPGVFPKNWAKPVVANVLDTTARQLAETLARLPQIECVTANTTSDSAKKFAAKKTKIALYYVDKSRFKVQLLSGADWFFTYGAMPIIIEPNFDDGCPHLRIDNPLNAYWDLDFYGRTVMYAKSWREDVGSLRAKFPELAAHISNSGDPFKRLEDKAQLEVVKLYDKSGVYLFLPEREGLLLKKAKNPLKDEVPVEVVERPRWDDENRGSFDDVMWVWLARARMAAYTLEATHKAVRAPISVGEDVQEFSFGPDAIIRSREPDKIRRVNLELPQSPLIQDQALEQEIDRGTRLPPAATGHVDASIITGQGIEALAGSFSTQIGAAQELIGEGLRRSLMKAFRMDEQLWGDKKKSITGTANGAPFSETYSPAKDIKGDYSVSVTYGFTAGMDPNRALVFLLQMRGDQAIDRDTLQRNLPFDIDIEQLQRRIDTEQIEDALKQGVFGYLAQAPMMEAQGMGSTLEAFQRGAEFVKLRNKGKSITDALVEAFQPKEEPQAPEMSQEEQMLEQMMGAGGPGGGAPPAPPEEHSQLGPGGSPDLMMMLSGLTSAGNPNLQANVSRRMPA